MWRIFPFALIFGALSLSCSAPYSGGTEVSSVRALDELDEYLDKKEHYVSQREERIKLFVQKARAAAGPDQQFELYNNLFDEYKSYISDSAFVYAGKAFDVASAMGDGDKIALARRNIAFCYLSSGFFRESADMMATIDPAAVSPEVKVSYYSLMGRLHSDMADYGYGVAFSADYIRRGIDYYDSVIVHTPGASPDIWSYMGFKRMLQRDYPAAIGAFKTLIDSQTVDDHTYAIASSSMGYMYWQLGDQESGLYYLAQAAIGDIRSATKEGVALMNLATLLYQRGDVRRANRYIRLAMDDAEFYNARLRKVQISNVLPIVEKELADLIVRQRNNLVVFVVVVSLLFVIVFSAAVIIFRQMKGLRKARRTIQHQNRNLKLSNGKLVESNEIKDEYIAQSLYVKSESLERLENLYKTINRKVMARQFDDIHSYLKESDLKKERENMYSSFDSTFLRLFPDFIEQYNELFRPEDRVVLDSSRRLTPELRIFALIRLGIGETERIARFLGYSVNTINTYKTKVKNKSLVQNEQFEQRVMSIRTLRTMPRQGFV